MQPLQDIGTRFAGSIHPLTGLHQSTWLGVVPTLSRDEIRQQKIIKALREQGACAKHRIVNLIHITPELVERNVDLLIAQGIVVRTIGPGVDGRGKKKLYSLKGTA